MRCEMLGSGVRRVAAGAGRLSGGGTCMLERGVGTDQSEATV